MKSFYGLLVLSLVTIGLAACSGDGDSSELPEVEGPALVMFYTDN